LLVVTVNGQDKAGISKMASNATLLVLKSVKESSDVFPLLKSITSAILVVVDILKASCTLHFIPFKAKALLNLGCKRQQKAMEQTRRIDC
jgi:hypothetical protein